MNRDQYEYKARQYQALHAPGQSACEGARAGASGTGRNRPQPQSGRFSVVDGRMPAVDKTKAWHDERH